MKIATWNVNGVRSAQRSGLNSWLRDGLYDLVCLQEVKMQEGLLGEVWFEPFRTYWNSGTRPGYSGVATLVAPSLTPIAVRRGVGDESLDSEGRVLTTEFDQFILINAYAPHSHRKLIRLEAKLKFCALLLELVRQVKQSKPVIIVGDLNVAHQEIDLANPKANERNAGYLPEERQWMTSLLELGLLDAFRVFNTSSGHYTWWSMRTGVRDRNVGWRLDYILVDDSFRPNMKICEHQPYEKGSDHCPVYLDIDIR